MRAQFARFATLAGVVPFLFLVGVSIEMSTLLWTLAVAAPLLFVSIVWLGVQALKDEPVPSRGGSRG